MKTKANSEHVANIVRKSFPFGISKLPLQTAADLKTPHFGLFRDDTWDCVGNAVRKGYTPHTTDDVVALAEAACQGIDGECVVQCEFNNGHFVAIRPTDRYRREICGSDTVWPQFLCRAGYDGRTAQVSLGLHRDACRNLEWIRDAGGKLACESLRHTSGLRDRMGEIIEQFRNLTGRWDGVVERCQEWEAQRVDFAEFVRRVYPQPAEPSKRQQNAANRRLEALVTRLFDERRKVGKSLGSTREVSVWEAYNAVTGYVQHDKHRQGQPSDFTRALKCVDDKDCRRAEEVALAICA